MAAAQGSLQLGYLVDVDNQNIGGCWSFGGRISGVRYS
jgi:hypothetical protein